MLRAQLLAALVLVAPATARPAEPAVSAPAAQPVPAARPAGKVELVEVQTEDKLTLKASFYPPRGKGRQPGVILVHGAGGDRGGYADLAEKLQRSGFGVLTFDVRGHGASKSGDLDWESLSPEERGRTWTYALRDLTAAVLYLRNRDEIHSSNLTVVGVGEGSALATRYAIRDENIRGVVMVAPQSEVFGFDLAGDVIELGGLPTLIIAPNKTRTSAERLREAGHRENGGYEYIEVAILREGKDPDECVLENKRLGTELTKWLKEKVNVKRGS